MNARILETPEEVAAAAAELVAEAIEHGARTLTLAGGSTPRRAYQLLAGRPLEWGRVTVLFGDERCLPPDDAESNYWMAKQELLDRVHPATVHRMPAELRAEGYAVGVRNSPKPPPERVSMTLTALREARRVIFLVTGADKADAVVKARQGEVPSGMVPEAEYLLDRAAASKL